MKRLCPGDDLHLFADAPGLEDVVAQALLPNPIVLLARDDHVLAGLDVTIMSRHTFGLDPEPTRLRCLDVEGCPLENHWYLAHPGGNQLSTVARAFVDFIRVHARALMRESLGQR